MLQIGNTVETTGDYICDVLHKYFPKGKVRLMSTLSRLLNVSPFKLRVVMITLFGIGVFVGSGSIAYGQEVDPFTALNENLDNFILVVAAALVFFMQARFAFLRAGLIRSKNTVNYMTKSFLDF